jgi:hypothetical protein
VHRSVNTTVNFFALKMCYRVVDMSSRRIIIIQIVKIYVFTVSLLQALYFTYRFWVEHDIYFSSFKYP